jgi:putative hemolysin
VVLIVIKGALAMSELAAVSARLPRSRAVVERGTPGGGKALALAADPGRSRSSVQIGFAMVGILSRAFAGATLSDCLSAWFGGSVPRWRRFSYEGWG